MLIVRIEYNETFATEKTDSRRAWPESITINIHCFDPEADKLLRGVASAGWHKSASVGGSLPESVEPKIMMWGFMSSMSGGHIQGQTVMSVAGTKYIQGR